MAKVMQNGSEHSSNPFAFPIGAWHPDECLTDSDGLWGSRHAGQEPPQPVG
ncbi:MAG: hypothetical protein H8D77_02240 [Chloroflexi bacterium]|nr:hypothetical protein [Chloroflexota bacterium]